MSLMAGWVSLIFIVTLLALVRWQHQATRIFGIALLALYLPGALSTENLIASAGNSGLVTLVLLICASYALEKTFLLQRLARWMLVTDYAQCWRRVVGCSVFTSSLLNNTAIVSILLNPLRNNDYHSPSRLILPMTFAVSMGGMLTLVGTSTNLIVNTMVIDAGLPALNFWDFLPVGGLATFLGVVVLWWSSKHLPNIQLVDEQKSTYFLETYIANTSSLIGKTIADAGLRHLQSLFLVEIIREGYSICPVAPSRRLYAGDKLIFSGDVKNISLLSRFNGLHSYAQKQGLSSTQLTEVLLLPESTLCGVRLKDSDFRAKFDAAIVAIRRDGLALSGALGDIVLKSGDYLVLTTGEDFAKRSTSGKNFLLIKGAKLSPIFSNLTEWLLLLGFILAIALSAIGMMSLLKSMVVYLGITLLTGVLTINELRRRFPVGLWVIVVSALGLAKAMDNSGLLNQISHIIETTLSTFPPHIALIGMFLATWMVTEVITNNAAAAMMLPIALAVAKGMGVSAMPFVMVVAYAASCSFISPYGYQTNLMAFNAGRYRLIDFVKTGWPLVAIFALVIISTTPLFFPF